MKIEQVNGEELLEYLTGQLIFYSSCLGFKSEEEYENYKFDAQEGMIKFGGSFVSALGRALAHADINNTYKILSSFKECADEHAALMRKWRKDGTI